jgi:Protein of unknown function (DUF732)
MKNFIAAAVGSVIATGGLFAAAAGLAASAQADPATDLFLNSLNNAGFSNIDPSNAIALGQSVCPMLANSGQTTADVASKVADSGGMGMGPATMFTGLAISALCPSAINRLSDPGNLTAFTNNLPAAADSASALYGIPSLGGGIPALGGGIPALNGLVPGLG